MGYSITEATHQRIESRRREGRLCGGHRGGHVGCLVKARVKVWTTTTDQPAPSTSLRPMQMCPTCYRTGALAFATTEHPLGEFANGWVAKVEDY